MSFAADLKDFSSGFATGWKLATPTRAEADLAALDIRKKELDLVKNKLSGGEARTSALFLPPKEGEEATPNYNLEGKVPSFANLPPEQVDYLVRTVHGEAANEPPEGKKGVAAVIKNRVAKAGTDPKTEVLKPAAFEPWHNPAARRRMLALDPASPAYQNTLKLVRDVWEGGEDPTGGATHFYAPKAQKALGRSVPSWATGQGFQIGNHTFFKLPYSGKGRHGVDQRAEVTPEVTQTALDLYGDEDQAQYAQGGGLVGKAVGGLNEQGYGAEDPEEEGPSMASRFGYDARELISGGSIPKMISTGVDYLTRSFGLNSGALPDQSPRAQEGAKAFAAGAGTPTPDQVESIMRTTDPYGSLPKEQRHVVGWGNLYHYFADRGDAAGAARASAAMLMFSKNVSRQAGLIATAALEKGDYQKASDAIAAAYDYLPDGKAIKVKNVGPGGVEYETVDIDGKRVDKGKISRQELGDVARGMVDGTLWFQSVNAASEPVDKKARRDVQTAKNVDNFLELAGDATSVDELTPEARKAYSALSASEKRAWQSERRTEAKTRKTESEAQAEAEFSESPELRDQFLSDMSDKDRAAYGRMSNAGKARAIAAGIRKLKEQKAEGESKAEADYLTGDAEDDFLASRTEAQREAYLKMGDKGKARALASFKDDRRQAFNEFKFDERMKVNSENRDRSEALKLFGMAQRYGMWNATREQVMTENERRAAQREAEEEGRNKRQELSIAQQNKVQENIDRRILEKRTATTDGAGAKLTPIEARRRRELGAANETEQRALEGVEDTTGVQGAGSEGAMEARRQRLIEERVAPIRAQGGFERIPAAERKVDPEDVTTIRDSIQKGEEFKALPAPHKVWAQHIATDITSTSGGKIPADEAVTYVQTAIRPENPEPRVLLPSGMVQLSPELPPVHMTAQSLIALNAMRKAAQANRYPPFKNEGHRGALPITPVEGQRALEGERTTIAAQRAREGREGALDLSGIRRTLLPPVTREGAAASALELQRRDEERRRRQRAIGNIR